MNPDILFQTAGRMALLGGLLLAIGLLVGLLMYLLLQAATRRPVLPMAVPA